MRRIAPVLDFAVIVVFVLVGRREHGLDNAFIEILRSLWPFLVGWFGFALATKLYVAPRWNAWLITWLGGVSAALVLRVVASTGNFALAFTLLTLLLLGAGTGGWRAIAVLVARSRARHAS